MRLMLAVTLSVWPLAGMAGPSSSGDICAGLKDGTPGLHGLCVAYCEAQGLGGSEDVDSKRSALSLLTAYERRRQEGDPDMPCLVGSGPSTEPPPQVNCSCWSADDLQAALPSPACQVVGTTYAAGQENGGSASVALVVAEPMQFSRLCQFDDGLSSSPIESRLIFGLTDEDMRGCVALWEYHARRTGCLVE